MVKNQHYIPRFYLKNFAASDSMLSVIRIENGKPGSVFRCKPDGICSEKYLHEVKAVRRVLIFRRAPSKICSARWSHAWPQSTKSFVGV